VSPRTALRLRASAVLAAAVATLCLAGCTKEPAQGDPLTTRPVSAPSTQGPSLEPTAVEREAEPAASFAYAPGAREVVFEPRLSAKSYVAIDAESGEILIARRERQRRPIASLTKVMTALLVIEKGELGKKVRVPEVAVHVEPNREDLKKDHWYTRRLLLNSALLVSANDSAVTLAYDAGRGSLKRFFRLMNARAGELGMTDTRYRSASGLDDETNYSSARDQAILARAALADPTFAAIVRTPRRVVDWPAPTFKKEWLNHNRMLTTYPGTYGVKTGYTAKAGACLAVAVRRNGHAVIAVMLDSRRIWVDTPRLVDAAFARIGA
jgi:D-alanyl-D-alanine carboxypeptidase